MPMNGTQLAGEMLKSIGGRVTPARLRAFQHLAEAIVAHIQNNMVVTAAGTDSHGDSVTAVSTLVQ